MIKHCPDCGEELVLRMNKESGEKFYGCSAYPECNYVEEIHGDDDGFGERRSEINFR